MPDTLELLSAEEERRFQRALRAPLHKRLQVWFWVSRAPGAVIVLCLVFAALVISAGGTWVRLEFLRWLGLIQ